MKRTAVISQLLATSLLVISSNICIAAEGNRDNQPVEHRETTHDDYSEAQLLADLGLSGQQVIYQNAAGDAISAREFMEMVNKFKASKSEDQAFSLSKIIDEKTHQVTVKAALVDKKTLEQPAINIAMNAKMPPLSGKNLLGKNTIIDFAATKPNQTYTLISSYFLECGACIKEVPAIKEFIKQYPHVAVHYVTFEPVEQSRKFASQYQINAEIISDATDWLTQVGISGYPTVILLNQAGEVMAAESGYSEQDKLKFVEALLPPPSS